MRAEVARAAWMAVIPLALACATSERITAPHTAREQILSSKAIDRALDQIHWPDLTGQNLIVRVSGPLEFLEYVLRSVEVLVAERGGRVVIDQHAADYEVDVLVGVVGVDVEGRFFGVRGVGTSLFLPFSIPELAFYKSRRLQGFAETEVAMLDRDDGGVAHRSGPTYGVTYDQSRTFLFVFRSRSSNTVRLDELEPRERAVD